MNGLRRCFVLGIFVVMTASWMACDDEVTDDSCVGDECVKCQAHQECGEDHYCNLEQEVCLPTICEPQTRRCEGSSVVYCNQVGSEYLETETCESGVCEDGRCGCGEESDCSDGEDCVEGQCLCASQQDCSGLCCGSGESCVDIEICEDGTCEGVSVCRPECDGSFCGDVCCEGETPNCSPGGGCAPSCEGQGELCGDDFDRCCPEGDVCVFGDCRTPGQLCETFTDCDFGEYCDTGLQRCMLDEFPDGLVCELDYDFDPFEVDQSWHWDGVEIAGVKKANVANTPGVADMNGGGTPEVVFTAYRQNINRGVLVVASGEDGSTTYVNAERWLRSREHPAIGDIDGDGYPEMVVSTVDGIAVIDDIVSCADPSTDPDGCALWTATVEGASLNQAPLLADVTGDGRPEVIYLHSVFDGVTGALLARAPQGQASMPVVVDLTGDGVAEILTAGCAFHYIAGETELQQLWCNQDLPGSDTLDSDARNYLAVGDVIGGTRQGRPEVIWVGDGEVFLVDELTGDIIERFDLPGAIRGGPPVVADFDGDGSAEIGVGGQTCYTIFDLDCMGSDDEDLPGCTRPVFPDCEPGVDCVVEPCSDLEGGTGDGILWSIEIIESVTGTGFASAVFDFQGNGRHEVVYGDHCRIFVLDGQTGSPLMTRFASRRANTEMPIVVDVNGDGRSNILFQANSDQFERDCEQPIANRADFFGECHLPDPPDYCSEGNQGVFALSDPNDAWVRTRAVWNQHAYLIDNIEDDGIVSTVPARPWETHNTFRANRQGDIPLNAADVVVSSVQVSTLSCPPSLDFQVTIQNMGISAIPSGLPVSLYNEAGDQRLKTVSVPTSISPGGTVVVEFSYELHFGSYNTPLTFQVVANDDGSSVALVKDCNPDSASAQVEEVVCRYVL